MEFGPFIWLTAEVYTHKFLSAKRLRKSVPANVSIFKVDKIVETRKCNYIIEIALTLDHCCGEGICCSSIARFCIPNLKKMILYHICVELSQTPCLIAPVNGTNFTRETNFSPKLTRCT